jgi:hypothetical protein
MTSSPLNIHGTNLYEMAAIPEVRNPQGAASGFCSTNIDGQTVCPKIILPHSLAAMCGTAASGPVVIPLFASGNNKYTDWLVQPNVWPLRAYHPL